MLSTQDITLEHDFDELMNSVRISLSQQQISESSFESSDDSKENSIDGFGPLLPSNVTIPSFSNFIKEVECIRSSLNSMCFPQNPCNPFAGKILKEDYSRKVFIGGLPVDITEEELKFAFSKFGQLTVDWPGKKSSSSPFPPKGYCYITFQHDEFVNFLLLQCKFLNGQFFYQVSSPLFYNKLVQIRPWLVSDSHMVVQSNIPFDSKKTARLLNLPRPIKAKELVEQMQKTITNICYVSIDLEHHSRYPKSCGYVSFSDSSSYVKAVAAKTVTINFEDTEKIIKIFPSMAV